MTLAAQLDAARITGEVATPRENNLLHIRRFLDQEDGFHFGVELHRAWSYEKVFALMVERVGIQADPEFLEGQDTISAALCIAALDRYAERLGRAVEQGESILFASGHPAGMVPVYLALADAVRSGGGTVVTAEGGIPIPSGGDLRHIGGVWHWHQHGSMPHTHAPEPMRALLDALPETPGLIVADHGWAGAAGTAGLEVIGVADCNDPALFVAEEQGQVRVTVPLDDNVPTQRYGPMIAYIAERAGLPQPRTF